MRLERGPEPRLALELRPGVLELVTGVLELALEDALLADRFAAFGRARGLPGEQAEQDAVVVEEERPGIRVDDQPSLAPQVRFDRKGDGRLAGRVLAVARRGTVDTAPRPACGVGGVPSTIRTAGGVAERDDRCRSVRDRPGRVRESDPERIRVAVDRRAEEALAEVEGDGPLLEPAKRDRRDEGGEVAQPGRRGPGSGRWP